MSTTPSFVFDKNYKNHDQVRPYQEAYDAVRAELDAAGQYPYNDSFKGRIPGIEGPDEDAAIYLLQGNQARDALRVRVEATLAAGAEHVETLDKIRRGTVIHYGYYMGDTGWSEWTEARLVPRDGRPYAVLPKGRRTNGFSLSGGHVLLIPAEKLA